MANPIETELKLELADASAAALRASGLLVGEPAPVHQTSVYYDTPDHTLAKAGVSLRLRSANGRVIQTAKANSASTAGLFARSEWERVVEGEQLVLEDTPIPTLLGEETAALAPAFRVDVERQTWVVREGDAEIEVVLDHGEASAGKRRTPVRELELELKQGDLTALFAFARKLDAVAPVRLGVLTKAERGYRLTQPRQRMVKAEPVLLDDRMTAAEAFQRSAQSCLRQFRLNEDRVLDQPAAKPLHQARVALRRLRSAFSIYRPVFGADPRAATFREELRWLSGELGEARNLDVLLERSSPGALHDRLTAERGAAYAIVTQALGSHRVRGLMLDLAEWLVAGDWLRVPATEPVRGQPADAFAANRLQRYRRRVKKDGASLKAVDDEARHELRKEAKRLRYAAEFFQSLFGRKRARRRFARFIGALEDLQDQLGALNDLATAPEVLDKLGVGSDPEAASLLASGNKPALIKAAARAHDALIETKRFWR